MGGSHNGITYRIIGHSDMSNVLAIFENTMIYGEPVCRALGMKAPDDTSKVQEKFLPCVLNSQLSIGAFDGENGEMVGYRLSSVHRSTDDTGNVYDVDDPTTAKMAKFEQTGKHLFEGVDIFEKAGADVVVMFRGLAVKGSHRRRGIGGYLVEEAIRVSRSAGYKAVVVDASSNFSRAIFNRLNFETLKTMDASELMCGDTPLYEEGQSTGPHITESIHMLLL